MRVLLHFIFKFLPGRVSGVTHRHLHSISNACAGSDLTFRPLCAEPGGDQSRHVHAFQLIAYGIDNRILYYLCIWSARLPVACKMARGVGRISALRHYSLAHVYRSSHHMVETDIVTLSSYGHY